MISTQFSEAIRFAADKRNDQRKKDPRCSPCILHHVANEELMIAAGITNEATLIAAVLHDTIEDISCTADEIAVLFGSEIVTLTAE